MIDVQSKCPPVHFQLYRGITSDYFGALRPPTGQPGRLNTEQEIPLLSLPAFALLGLSRTADLRFPRANLSLSHLSFIAFNSRENSNRQRPQYPTRYLIINYRCVIFCFIFHHDVACIGFRIVVRFHPTPTISCILCFSHPH